MAQPKRWIALLRGINVGGKNKLKMAALAELFEGLGCNAVRTYIQSGNVVFEAGSAKAKSLPDQVESAILDEFGLRVPIIIRSAEELRTAIENNPFDTPKLDPKLLSVGFLKGKPTAARIAQLDPNRSPGDRYQVEGVTHNMGFLQSIPKFL